MAAIPVVLIHGFPFDSTLWQPLATLLRAKGRTVHTPDLPGFGLAGEPAAAPTMETYAEAVYEFISRHGGRAVVGGFSMGGYVALALLRKYPQVFAGLMLLDSRAEDDSDEARQARLNSIEEIKNGGVAKVIETLLGKQLSKNAAEGTRKMARQIMRRQKPEAIIAAQNAMARRRDQSDLLSGLSIPVLLLVGAEDAITPPSVALQMQRLAPRAMLVQIASAGHMAPLEEPASVAAAIETFLATVPA